MTEVRRYIAWLCEGCEACGPSDGSPRITGPCTDRSPSLNGAEVVRAEDYDALRASTIEAVSKALRVVAIGNVEDDGLSSDEEYDWLAQQIVAALTGTQGPS